VTEKGSPNLSEEEQKNLPTEQMDTFSEQETGDQIMKDPAIVAAEQKAREALDKLYETEEKVKAGTATQAELSKARQDYEAAKSAFDGKVDSAVSRLPDSSYPEKDFAGRDIKLSVSYHDYAAPQTPRKEVEVVPVNGLSDAALANLRTAQGKATRALAGAAMNSQGAQRNFENSVRLAQNVSLMGQLLGLGDDALKQLQVDRDNLERAIARERELKEQQRDLEGAEKEIGSMYESAAVIDKAAVEKEKAAALKEGKEKDDALKEVKDLAKSAKLLRETADQMATTWADKDISALSAADAQAYREGLQELNERLDETIFLAKVGGTTASVVRETAHVAGVGIGFVTGGPAGGAIINLGLRMVEGSTEELTKVAMGEQSYEEAGDAFRERFVQAGVESGITLVAGAAGSKLSQVVQRMNKGPLKPLKHVVDVVGTGLVQSGGTAIQIGVEFAQAKSEFDKQSEGLTGAEREQAYKDFMEQNGLTLEKVTQRLVVSLGAGAGSKVLGNLAKKASDEVEEFTSELGEQLGHGQPLTAETLVAAAVGSHATKRGVQSSANSQNGGIAPPAPNDPPHVKAAASKVDETQAAYEAAKASGQNVEAAEAAYKSAISHDNAVRQDHADKPVEKPTTVVENARNRLLERVEQAPSVAVTNMSTQGSRDPVLSGGTRVQATTGTRSVTYTDNQGNQRNGIALRPPEGETEMGALANALDRATSTSNRHLRPLLPKLVGRTEVNGVTYLIFDEPSGGSAVPDFDSLPDSAESQLTESLRPEALEALKSGAADAPVRARDLTLLPDGTVRLNPGSLAVNLPQVLTTTGQDSARPSVPADPNLPPSDPFGLRKDISPSGLGHTHRSPEERMGALLPEDRQRLRTNMDLNDAGREAAIARDLGLQPNDPKVKQLLDLHHDPSYPGTLEGSTQDLTRKIDAAMEILHPGYGDMTPDQRRGLAGDRRTVVDAVRTGLLGEASDKVRGLMDKWYDPSRDNKKLFEGQQEIETTIREAAAVHRGLEALKSDTGFRDRVEAFLTDKQADLRRHGLDSRLTSLDGFPVLYLYGGGPSLPGQWIANASTSLADPSLKPLGVYLDPVGTLGTENTARFDPAQNRIRLLDLDTSEVTPSLVHELFHAENHLRTSKAARLRMEGSYEEANTLHAPEDFSINLTSNRAASLPRSERPGYSTYQSGDEALATLRGALANLNIAEEALQHGNDGKSRFIAESRIITADMTIAAAEALHQRARDSVGQARRVFESASSLEGGSSPYVVGTTAEGHKYRSHLNFSVRDGVVIAELFTEGGSYTDGRPAHGSEWIEVPLFGAKDASPEELVRNKELLKERLDAIEKGVDDTQALIEGFKAHIDSLKQETGYVDPSQLPTGAAGGSKSQPVKPFDPTTLDQPDSPLMFQPNSPYVESGFVGRRKLSETNEYLRRAYTDRPAMAAEFSTMKNPPKLLHGSTSASLLMYITPQYQKGKEQTAQDQLRSQNRQGQLRPSGAIEASLGAVFSGEIVFGKSNTNIAVVDVTDIGKALDYAEGRHSGYWNSMNWSPEIAHQRIADADERRAKEEKMAREGGFSETYQNSRAARRNDGTLATERLRLAEWPNLSSLEMALVSQQFPVVYGIDTSRQKALSIPSSDIPSELRLEDGTTGDEIRAVFVPKDKIPLVQSLVGDKGPRVLDIDLLKPDSALNQPNQSDAVSKQGAIQPAPVDPVQDPTEVVKALVYQSGGADLAATTARSINQDALINLERRYDAMLARDKGLELSPEEITAFRQEVTSTLEGVRQSLAAQGVDATLMRGPHGYPLLELDGGGDTRLGRVVGNAKSQFERRSGGAPLRVTWDPIGNVQEQSGGFYENQTRTVNLGRNGVLNPDALDPTTIHELGHAFRHAKLLGAAAARKGGDVEGLQKLHDPLYGTVGNTHQDFSLGDKNATVAYKNYTFDEVASWRSDVTTNLANISSAIERGDHATASATLRSATDRASLYVGLSARLRAVTAQLEATLSKPRSGAGEFFHGDGLNGHVDFIPSSRFDGVEAIATFIKTDAAGQTQDSFTVSIPLIEATGVRAGDFERNVELLRAQVTRSREALDTEVNGFQNYSTRLQELGANIQ
jgi:hypothetical protein